MKQSVLVLLVLVLVAGCNKRSEYTIKGKLSAEMEGTIYLQQRINGAFASIDSVEMVGGKFTFKGNVDGADAYYLSNGDGDRKLVFLDNTKFSVKSDSTALSNAVVTGGEAQTLYNEYEEKYNRLYDYMLGEYYKIRDEEDEDKKKAMEAHVDSLYEDVELFQKVFMIDHSSSPVAAYILTQIQYGHNALELDELLQKLDTSLVYTVTYQFIANRVKELQKVAIGKIVPDFTQNDSNGNPVTFSDVYSANKLTLIDFWASWCGPCRQENPNVVKAYNKYHDKGFTVLGVSLDSNKNRWLKAIEEDGLVWQHVSDLQGWDNNASKEYAVNSIPANFLVDQKGEIIAAGLRGDDLLNKLENTLK